MILSIIPLTSSIFVCHVYVACCRCGQSMSRLAGLTSMMTSLLAGLHAAGSVYKLLISKAALLDFVRL